ncbi:phosphohistidine phosphatase SixA [Marinomonas dokdonensis]|uniref:phosphohistidine phosphatase SixA n=1 Tax=Marinomonas dokdonensis TaxID=328224 RepID=UPI0040558E03
MKKLKRLYVLRHGEAEPYGYDVADEMRQLTEFGRQEVSATAKDFFAKGLALDAVMVSPYLRAQQTADIFCDQLGNVPHRDTNALITPYGKAMQIADWLADQPFESILLVTHQPFAYELVAYLADAPLPRDFAMTTATLACLESDDWYMACAQYQWFISPSC